MDLEVCGIGFLLVLNILHSTRICFFYRLALDTIQSCHKNVFWELPTLLLESDNFKPRLLNSLWKLPFSVREMKLISVRHHNLHFDICQLSQELFDYIMMCHYNVTLLFSFSPVRQCSNVTTVVLNCYKAIKVAYKIIQQSPSYRVTDVPIRPSWLSQEVL